MVVPPCAAESHLETSMQIPNLVDYSPYILYILDQEWGSNSKKMTKRDFLLMNVFYDEVYMDEFLHHLNITI